MDNRRVLVLTTDRQTGLAIVRSLGARGVSVVAGGPTAPTLGMLSRHSDDRYVHPDPQVDRDAFVADLVSFLRAENCQFVFGPTDQMTYLLSEHRSEIEATGTVPAVEEWDTFQTVFDKARLFEWIEDVDVPAPETHAPATVDELESLASELTYPQVVKPRSKTMWEESGYSVHLVDDDNYATDPADLVATYRRLVESAPAHREHAPIVQAYVEGQTTTTVALADEGDVRAYFQERRLRTVPPSGGSSALLGVVDDDRMLTYAERIISALSWTGPIQVEFMELPDGGYTLIEVNGRYWGSLPLAITCGVDFPWLHYRQLLGEEVYHDGTYRTDVRQRRTAQDVDWLEARLAAGHFDSLVPFVLDFGRVNHTFVSLRDPLPTAWVLAQGPRLLVRELAGLGRSLGTRVLPGGRLQGSSRGGPEAPVGATDVDHSSTDGE